MGSEQNGFPPPPTQEPPPPPPPPPPRPRHKRWVGCWGGSSCFGKQKGGKRIVPASRIPEANSLANQPNGPQVGAINNQTTGLTLSLLAPPSSPASFSNSAIASTAQSPNCFLSANSPGGPSSTMFATGPYAHETQLVSPPVFSTFTTEPSTAPLTPPPELAHLTTPSSPDVPYAQFLSSSANLKTTNKSQYGITNDLQSAYLLDPGSPASSLRSPTSRTAGDCLSSSFTDSELPAEWDPSVPSQEFKYQVCDSGGLHGTGTAETSKLSQDSNFFCPATFAQFYIDHSLFPHSGGRISVSKEPDAYSNGHQNKQNKTCKQDTEEIEAYRASFGFSADEIVTTTQYVEISDVLDDSFTMTPFASSKPQEKNIMIVSTDELRKVEKSQKNVSSPQYLKSSSYHAKGPYSNIADHSLQKHSKDIFGQNALSNHAVSDDEDVFSKMGNSRHGRKHPPGLSSSDAEIDYRRGRSLREGKSYF